MKSRSHLAVRLLTISLLAVPFIASAQQPVLNQAKAAPAAAPAPAPATDTASLLKQVLENQRNLDFKLADIQKRLDSISQFLGDQRSSGFDTVDRRLRDIADDVKDLKH